jgi:signal transduction histidine kinase
VTFARRLTTSTAVILIVVVVLLVWGTESVLRRQLEANVTRTLEREAQVLRDALPADTAAWQVTINRYGLDLGLRITIIAADGRVLADSDFPDGPPATTENHASRPEVQAAFRGATGHMKRHSATVGRDLRYVAIPGGKGAIRVAEDLDAVNAIIRRSQLAVAGAALVALIVGLGFAGLAARRMAQPLTGLAATAREIAAGAEPVFPRANVGEIDVVIAALRDMHGQIGERFAARQQEREETAAVVEAMADGVVAGDAEGTITLANGAARRLLGLDASSDLPPLTALFGAGKAQQLVHAALAGDAPPVLSLELHGHSLALTARALPAGGAVLVLRDQTDLRRLESVRRDFVANVSHELRTPLTSISGYAETLLDDRPDPDTARRFLEVILANARRMHHLVSDLLELSRVESGRWQPAPAPVDPAELAREVWDSLGNRAGESGVTLRTTVPAGLRVFADADALRQVLTNLIDNALRYTAAGGEITVRAAPEEGAVRLSVSDTGVGIAPEHLDRVFERFYRADPSRTRAEGGTGLGLSIVRHLVESHGGRVWADSVLGQGTSITCWFPGPR